MMELWGDSLPDTINDEVVALFRSVFCQSENGRRVLTHLLVALKKWDHITTVEGVVMNNVANYILRACGIIDGSTVEAITGLLTGIMAEEDKDAVQGREEEEGWS